MPNMFANVLFYFQFGCCVVELFDNYIYHAFMSVRLYLPSLNQQCIKKQNRNPNRVLHKKNHARTLPSVRFVCVCVFRECLPTRSVNGLCFTSSLTSRLPGIWPVAPWLPSSKRTRCARGIRKQIALMRPVRRLHRHLAHAHCFRTLWPMGWDESDIVQRYRDGVVFVFFFLLLTNPLALIATN